MAIQNKVDITTVNGQIINTIENAKSEIDTLRRKAVQIQLTSNYRPLNEFDCLMLKHIKYKIEYFSNLLADLRQLLKDNKDNEWFSIPNLY